MLTWSILKVFLEIHGNACCKQFTGMYSKIVAKGVGRDHHSLYTRANNLICSKELKLCCEAAHGIEYNYLYKLIEKS